VRTLVWHASHLDALICPEQRVTDMCNA